MRSNLLRRIKRLEANCPVDNEAPDPIDPFDYGCPRSANGRTRAVYLGLLLRNAREKLAQQTNAEIRSRIQQDIDQMRSVFQGEVRADWQNFEHIRSGHSLTETMTYDELLRSHNLHPEEEAWALSVGRSPRRP